MRLAKSLATLAAVAIQNARLYERAEIYGAELEQRLADLEMTQQALRLAEEGRTLSEEGFTKVFRSSPIAFSITTVGEGRFVDVNDAFERLYGYAREQLIGRTVFEIGIWDDASERRQVLNEIRQQDSVRNRVTRFRRSSGELIDTIFSAEAVEVDSRECPFWRFLRTCPIVRISRARWPTGQPLPTKRGNRFQRLHPSPCFLNIFNSLGRLFFAQS